MNGFPVNNNNKPLSSDMLFETRKRLQRTLLSVLVQRHLIIRDEQQMEIFAAFRVSRKDVVRANEVGNEAGCRSN